MKDKKILRYIILLGIIAAVLFFAGCELGDSSDPEFVGSWVWDAMAWIESLEITETSIVIKDFGLYIGTLTLQIVSYSENANHIHAQVVSATGFFNDPTIFPPGQDVFITYQIGDGSLYYSMDLDDYPESGTNNGPFWESWW